eukprot:CAMPEP_0179144884 /NCGR_PEP_ID=MMETSP0796-20121207/69851_1 /TAXON_ID=73915 /ORGANISM="Pyrodinium bahamense, Strain pbaha01" /LENGTH=34 /DNA_ID= /DNA_START= /DNA_END= /DNA_ORIENTATION=
MTMDAPTRVEVVLILALHIGTCWQLLPTTSLVAG